MKIFRHVPPAFFAASVFILSYPCSAAASADAPGMVAAWGVKALPPEFEGEIFMNVSAGEYHNLALRTDGTVVAWGQDDYGQSTVPPALTNVAQIAGGWYHSLVVLKDGTIRGWGQNYFQQAAAPPGLSNVMAIAAGMQHSMALTSNGTVRVWGANANGQTNVPPDLANVVSIAAGGSHCLALRDDGTVVGWGATNYNQAVVPPGLSNVASIAAGYVHSCALQSNGTVIAWGRNNFSQTNIPTGLSNVVAIAASGNRCLALLATGTVIAWGDSINGQGVVPAALTNASAITVGERHALALRRDGTLLAWGWWDYGQSIVPPNLTNVVEVAAGSFHSLARKADGTVVGWGRNASSECNIPAGLPKAVRVTAGYGFSLAVSTNGTIVGWGAALYSPFSPPIGLSNVTDIAAGDSHCLALRNDETVVAWGYNWSGQTNVPHDLTDVTAIAAGGSYSIALKRDGTIIAWGDNSYGQTNVPDMGKRAIAIAASPFHCLAVLEDKTVRTWGYGFGGLTNIPPTATNVTAVAAGNGFSLALRTDGTIVAWGLTNSYGQSVVPVDVTNAIGVAAGSSHSLAILSSAGLPPTIILQPQAISVAAGGTAMFEVSASGSAPLGLFWHHNGQGLTEDGRVVGVHNNSLTINSVAPNDQGTYSVIVSNTFGVVTSDFANLIITNTMPGSVAGFVSAWGTEALPPAIQGVVFTQVSAGDYHGVGLRPDGTVVAWGQNDFNQGTIPVGLSNVVAVSARASHNLALKSDGTLVAWGTWLEIPSGLTNVVAVANGPGHRLALQGDGSVRSWGDNGNGQTNVPAGLSGVTAIAAGERHSLGLKSDGTVVAWGAGSTGQNGYPHYGQAMVPTNFGQVAAISAGNYHTLLLKSNGTVVAWGRNDEGQCTVPTGLSNIIAIAAGAYHSLALASNGTLVVWGGSGSIEGTIPVGLSNVIRIASGSSVNYALKSDGTLAGWGWYDYGQSHAPSTLTNALAIAAGFHHNVALKSDGTVVCWGNGAAGQTNAPGGLTNVVAVAAGQDHTVALKSDGTVVAWGANYANQSAVPVGLNDAVAIAAGQYHSLALRRNGAVVAWGYNGFLQTDVPADLTDAASIAAAGNHCLALRSNRTVVAWGRDLTGESTVPAGLSNVMAIAAGGEHSLALKSDGTVIAWGYGGSGQTAVPQGLSNVKAVAAGWSHSLALRTDGSVVAWGGNLFNQARIPHGLTNVTAIAIAGGTYHSLALFGAASVLPQSPPTISIQPLSQSAVAGTNLTLWVQASGTSPFSYQWRKAGVPLADGGNIAGAATFILSLTNVHGGNSGGYTVVVSNAWGSVTSTVALVTVLDPMVVTQPASTNQGAGLDVTFTVTAAGTSPFSYQWWRNGSPVPGRTLASLTVTNLQGSDAGEYTVVVTNQWGSVTSAPAQLTVNPRLLDDSFAPDITGGYALTIAIEADGRILVGGSFSAIAGQPRACIGRLNLDGTVDRGFKPGDSNGITAMAVQADGAILVGGHFTSLSRRACTKLGRLSRDGVLDESFNANLTSYDEINSLRLLSDEKFLVSGKLGGRTVARMRMNGSYDALFPYVQMSYYDWYYWWWETGQVSPLLVQPDEATLVGGYFGKVGDASRISLCRLTPAGTVDDSFRDPIMGSDGIYHPRVTCMALQPDGKILIGGRFISLAGTPRTNLARLHTNGWLDTTFNPMPLDGYEVSALALQADGRILVGGNFTVLGGAMRRGIGRVNSDGTLDTSFDARANGSVQCIEIQPDGNILMGGSFTSIAGVPRTNLARLRNTGPAIQSLARDGTNITWLRGGTGPEVSRVTFHYATNGTEWHTLGMGARIEGGWQLSGATIPPNASIRARGAVAFGSSDWSVETMTGPPALSLQPYSVTNDVETQASFSVAAGGTEPLAFRWLKNGEALTDGGTVSGATTRILTISRSFKADEGGYSVIINNAAGSITSLVATLTVIDPPITREPTNQWMWVGGSVTFAAGAYGTAPLLYQWQHDGADIPGATNANLVVDTLEYADAGLYRCVFSNPFGSRATTNAQLDVVSVVALPVVGQTAIPSGLTNVTALAVGGSHTLALRTDGTVVAWTDGYDSAGAANVPADLRDVVAVAAGSGHSLALKEDGTLVAWGNSPQASVPTGLGPIASITADRELSFALKADGTVVAWGVHDNFGLTNVPAGLNNVVAVSAGGENHVLALRADGTVTAWGDNYYRQSEVPAGLSNVIAVAAGGAHSLALRANGTVVAWGESRVTDMPIGLSNVVGIAAGLYHSLVLKADGTLTAWGRTAYWGNSIASSYLPSGLSNVTTVAASSDRTNSFAVVGYPPNMAPPELLTPRFVMGAVERPLMLRIAYRNGATGFGAVGLPPGLNIDAATGIISGQPGSEGAYQIMLFATNGLGMSQRAMTLFVNLPTPGILNSGLVTLPLWSSVAYQVLTANNAEWFGAGGLPTGLQINPNSGLISGVPVIPGDFPVSLSASNRHGVGTGAIQVRVTPVIGWGTAEYAVTNTPAGLGDAIAITAGGSHNLALRSDGTVVGWGDNYYGQLSIPTDLDGVVAVAAGSFHSLALKSDGKVETWGQNSSGQASVPANLSGVNAIAAGAAHNLVLRTGGTVVAWGGNSVGQTNLPGNLTNVIAIAVGGGNHCLALKADRTVVAWGANNRGQTNVPANLSDVVAVAAGYEHSLALRSNGTVVAWGGYSLQLTNVPSGLSNVIAIAAGGNHSVALTADGTLVSWGDNSYGQTNSPTGLRKVVGIAAGGRHSLALVEGVRVPAPDLRVAAIEAPSVTSAERAFLVTWSVTNAGNLSVTNAWTDRIYLSSDQHVGNDEFLAAVTWTNGLSAGEAVRRVAAVTIPQSLGTGADRYLVVVTDSDANVFEGAAELNNTLVDDQPIRVTRLPMPDLIVESIDGPTHAFSGQTITINYTIKNVGDAATDAPYWFDWIYISADDLPEIEDVAKTSAMNVSYLAPGESYAGSVNLQVPKHYFGTYQLLVWTDSDGSNHRSGGFNVAESSNTNNWNLAVPIQIDIPPRPDLQVVSVHTAANSYSGQQIPVTFLVTNTGVAPVPYDEVSWTDKVFISSDTNYDAGDKEIGNFPHNAALGVGAAYDQKNQLVTVPPNIYGDFYIFVVADAQGLVYEANENNNANFGRTPLHVILTPPPDLVVNEVNAPTNATAGQAVPVTWRVTNQGLGDSVGSLWYDSVFLSSNSTFDASATRVATTYHSGVLAPGGSYDSSASFTLPLCAGTSYYVFVVSDSYTNITEFDISFDAETNNTARAAQPIGVAPQILPDLRLAAVTAPASGKAGTALHLTWTVVNGGQAGTWGAQWADRIYISSSNVFSSDNVQALFDVPHVGILAAGSNYTQSADVLLPDTLSGSYFLHVQADVTNAAPECGTFTNNVSVGRALTITPADRPELMPIAVAAPLSAQSGEAINVSWVVTNLGPGAVPNISWSDGLYLFKSPTNSAGAISLGTFDRAGAMAAGQGYTTSSNLTLPWVLSGTWYLAACADVFSSINEGSAETNNCVVALLPIQVTQTPLADLVVTNVVVPVSGTAGQRIAISWTVANNGAGETTANVWSDYVYLSRDQVFDGGDTQLAWVRHTNALAIGQNHTEAHEVMLPNGVAGPYYVFVVTDHGNVLRELDEINNASAPSTPISLTLQAPADLVVASVAVPPPASPGEMATFSWTITNQGSNAAVGEVEDAVYLSTDQTWDIGDPLVGKARTSISLLPGQSQPVALTAMAPSATPGPHYVMVRTDVRNAIRESSEQNNTGVSAAPMNLDVEELTLGESRAGSFNHGDYRYYKVRVPSNEVLRVTLTGINEDAFNELFVRFGAAPTRADFDFLYDKPFQPSQETTVPQTQDGYYYLMAHLEYLPVPPSEFSIKAELVPFSITSVSPTKIGDNGQVTITVKGARFGDRLSLQLVNGTNILLPESITIASNSCARARFIFQTVPHGLYDLCVSSMYGASNWLPRVVTVDATRAPVATLIVDGDTHPRVGGSARVNCLVFNNGNVDAEYVLVRMKSTGDPQFSLSHPNETLPRPSAFPTMDWDKRPPTAFLRGDSAMDYFLIRNLGPGDEVSFEVTGREIRMASPHLEIQAITFSRNDFVATCRSVVTAIRTRLLDGGYGASPEISSIVADEAVWVASVATNLVNLGYIDSVSEMSSMEQQRRTTKDVSQLDCSLCGDEYNVCLGLAGISVGLGAPGIAFGAGLYISCTASFYCCRVDCGRLRPPAVCDWSFYVKCGIVGQESRYCPLFSSDPNEIWGPVGFGDEHFVSKEGALEYTVHFENVQSATAVAREVIIRNQLSNEIDLRSVKLIEIGLGDFRIKLPGTRSVFQGRVPFETIGGRLCIDITAGVDPVSREMKCTLTAVDPNTGEPPTRADLGLLPPNDSSHRGEGYVTYTVMPKAGTPTGTIISNMATIIFDENEPIDTAPVWNTIDGASPTSFVGGLPPTITNSTFVVAWAGTDDAGGSRVGSYDIYVSENAGPYTAWINGTTENSAVFTGLNGHAYAFYSLARDNAGNGEAAKTNAEAQTLLVFNSPPTLAPIADRVLDVGQSLIITNIATDPDLPSQHLVFSLAPERPPGASVDPETGVFKWQPTRASSNRTNTIQVIVSDNGTPSLSATQSFQVFIPPVVDLGSGGTVALAGDRVCLPIRLFSAAGLTNLSFTVVHPQGRLTNMTIAPGVTQICAATLTPMTPTSSLVDLAVCAGNALSGTQQVADLCFTLNTNRPSAFMLVQFQNIIARQTNGSAVSNIFIGDGRVVAVERQPLLEPSLLEAGLRQLKLYGRPGTNYVVQSATNTGPNTVWREVARVQLTNLWTVLPASETPAPLVIYRAYETTAGKPMLSVQGGSGPVYTFLVVGQTGASYVIQTSTNLADPVTWNGVGSVTLTNSSGAFNWTNQSEQQRFFRAVEQ